MLPLQIEAWYTASPAQSCKDFLFNSFSTTKKYKAILFVKFPFFLSVFKTMQMHVGSKEGARVSLPHLSFTTMQDLRGKGEKVRTSYKFFFPFFVNKVITGESS